MNARIFSLFVIFVFALSMSAFAVETGKPAPDFKLTDTNGKAHSLSDFKGKTVVLEWTNYDCPFVKKFYDGGKMQELQASYTGKGVIWLSICSSADGKQGHYPAGEWNKMIAAKGAKATAVLLDADGKVGKLYGAKTTPHMFIVSADGNLVYQGAIDDKASYNKDDIAGARNYVAAALDEILAGKAVSNASSTPYGCSVKY